MWPLFQRQEIIREKCKPSNVAIQPGVQAVPEDLVIEQGNSVLATRSCSGTSQKEGCILIGLVTEELHLRHLSAEGEV